MHPFSVPPAPLSSHSPGRPKYDLAPSGRGSGAFPEPGVRLSIRLSIPHSRLTPHG